MYKVCNIICESTELCKFIILPLITIIILGGCGIEKRPSNNLICEPVCPVQSHCNDTDICICHEGYVAQTNYRGILQACLEANVTVEKDAQETGQSRLSLCKKTKIMLRNVLPTNLIDMLISILTIILK